MLNAEYTATAAGHGRSAQLSGYSDNEALLGGAHFLSIVYVFKSALSPLHSPPPPNKAHLKPGITDSQALYP